MFSAEQLLFPAGKGIELQERDTRTFYNMDLYWKIFFSHCLFNFLMQSDYLARGLIPFDIVL